MTEVITIIVLILMDQLTKHIAVTSLLPIKQKVLINGFFNLTYVENRGAAFGTMQGARWFFIILAAVVVIAVAYYYYKMEKTKENLWLRAALVMIVGGTLGNVIDRFFRGYVVDFFDFIIFGYDFPVFNIADILIVIGTLILAGYIIFYEARESAESKER